MFIVMLWCSVAPPDKIAAEVLHAAFKIERSVFKACNSSAETQSAETSSWPPRRRSPLMIASSSPRCQVWPGGRGRISRTERDKRTGRGERGGLGGSHAGLVSTGLTLGSAVKPSGGAGVQGEKGDDDYGNEGALFLKDLTDH